MKINMKEKKQNKNILFFVIILLALTAVYILIHNKNKSPKEIIECVELGVDIFDSVWPTRIARHGKVMTKNGSYNINKKEFELDLKPLDKSCNCKVCKNYTKSYLHHLYKVKEPLAMKLLSYHNLAFIQNLMKEIRTSIKNKKFNELKKKYKKV